MLYDVPASSVLTVSCFSTVCPPRVKRRVMAAASVVGRRMASACVPAALVLKAMAPVLLAVVVRLPVAKSKLPWVRALVASTLRPAVVGMVASAWMLRTTCESSWLNPRFTVPLAMFCALSE